MEIKGIIFSKDGTIIEFNDIWLDSTKNIIEQIIRSKFYSATEEEIQHYIRKGEESIGLVNGKLIDNSILANGTVLDVATALSEALNIRDDSLPLGMEDMYYDRIYKNRDQIKGIGNLTEFFQKLENAGYKVAIATTNSRDITELTLRELGIYELIDFIASSDEYPKKPDPFIIDEFAERFQFRRENIVVVGDTITDMEFAKNAGMGIGVLSGASKRESLEKFTEHIIDDITHLIDQEGRLKL